MKHISTRTRRILCALLAGLMLSASLASCVKSGGDTDTETTPPTGQVTDTDTADTAAPADTETEPPVDPDEPDADLSAAVVVVSPFAASWEKTAAEELAADEEVRRVYLGQDFTLNR